MSESNTIRTEGLRLIAIWQDAEQNTTPLRFANGVDDKTLDVTYDGLLTEDKQLFSKARIAPLSAVIRYGPDTVDSEQIKQLIADTKVNV